MRRAENALGSEGDPYDRLDISPRVEIADDLEMPGFEALLQHVENEVRCGFVGYALVPETVQIELQALEFDNLLTGGIGDLYGSKIRIPGTGAEAGELRTGYINDI